MSFKDFWKKTEDAIMGKEAPAFPPADLPDRDATNGTFAPGAIKAAHIAPGTILRNIVTHLTCNTDTALPNAKVIGLRDDPDNNHKLFCNACSAQRPRGEFVWAGTDQQVGT